MIRSLLLLLLVLAVPAAAAPAPYSYRARPLSRQDLVGSWCTWWGSVPYLATFCPDGSYGASCRSNRATGTWSVHDGVLWFSEHADGCEEMNTYRVRLDRRTLAGTVYEECLPAGAAPFSCPFRLETKMPVDFSLDYQAWDNTEQVSVEIPGRAAPELLSVAVAKRRAIRGTQKSPSGGVYVGYETRWLIPAAQLPPGKRPEPAWVVEDGAGQRWTTLTVEANKHGQTWALGCVDLVLALRLRDTVVIERAALSNDLAGAIVKTFPPDGGQSLYTLPARAQQVSEEIAEERGLRMSARHYEVILGGQVPLVDVEGDRVRWSDQGVTRYLVLDRLRQSDLIDFLPVLEAHETL